MNINKKVFSIKNFIDNLIKNQQGDLNILGKLMKIIIIFLIIKIIGRLINQIIEKGLDSKRKSKLSIGTKRARTLGNILKKLVNWILIFIWIMITLELFGISTTSILATAGIGGLAIGFGAQSLVKDIITGFFILLEDQYSVGDYIQLDSYDGIVEDLGLRVTKLRSFSGELHIIPNGNIQIVTNNTRGMMRSAVNISIAYEEDIDKAINVLEEVCQDIKNSNKNVLEGPVVVGVDDLGEYSVDIRIVAQVKAMEQWGVEREIRKKAKEALEREGIKIPYPRKVIIGADNK